MEDYTKDVEPKAVQLLIPLLRSFSATVRFVLDMLYSRVG